MSDPNHTNNLISRYNFSRRVVDHRIPHDFHYTINSPPLSKVWWGKAKQRMAGSLIYFFGAYVTGACVIWATVSVTADMVYRMDGKKGIPPSIMTNPNQTPAERYLFNHDNRTTDLGKWNHNFSCFENEKNCGRDFDWVRVNNGGNTSD